MWKQALHTVRECSLKKGIVVVVLSHPRGAEGLHKLAPRHPIFSDPFGLASLQPTSPDRITTRSSLSADRLRVIKT